MKNKEQKIVRLLEEGFSYETIKKMSNLHINKIYGRVLKKRQTTYCRKDYLRSTVTKKSLEKDVNRDSGRS